jgi:hypothetical protein
VLSRVLASPIPASQRCGLCCVLGAAQSRDLTVRPQEVVSLEAAFGELVEQSAQRRTGDPQPLGCNRYETVMKNAWNSSSDPISQASLRM